MSHWMQRSGNSAVLASGSHTNFAVNDSEEENSEIKLKPLLVQNADSLPSKSDIYASPIDISEKQTTWNCQQGQVVVASCVLDSAKVAGARIAEDRAEIANDAMAVASRNIRNERSGRDPFPLFNFNQKVDGTLIPRNGLAVCRKQASKSQRQLNSISRNAIQLSKHEESFENRSLPVPMPFQNNFMRFKVPYGVGGLMPVQSRGKESDQPSLQAILRKHLVDANFAHLDENNGRQFQRRQPTHSVHDVETLRICATVDSVEAVPGGPSKFSQTTHQLLITKRSDLNVLSEDEMIRKTKQPSNGKGSASHELVRLPIDFGSHELGRKLQTLGNSTEVGKLDTDSISLKSDSSAETDIMDIDDCQAQDALLGFAASPSTKDFKVSQNTAKSQATTLMLGEKNRSYLEKGKLRDISKEPLSLIAAESSMEKRGFSSSRTESLDAEHDLSYAERPENFSASQQDVPVGETSNRWVKRLKLSSSDSFPTPGIKSSKIRVKPFSSGSANKFGNTLKYDRNSSGPMLGKPVEKGRLVTDENLLVERNRESSSTDLAMKEFRNQTLSHPWIRRWRHNQAVTAKLKPTEAVICEPQSLEASLNEFQKKKLPSIAAMALMGKATNCFQPCEFRKKGPVVVWNSDGFQ